MSQKLPKPLEKTSLSYIDTTPVQSGTSDNVGHIEMENTLDTDITSLGHSEFTDTASGNQMSHKDDDTPNSLISFLKAVTSLFGRYRDKTSRKFQPQGTATGFKILNEYADEVFPDIDIFPEENLYSDIKKPIQKSKKRGIIVFPLLIIILSTFTFFQLGMFLVHILPSAYIHPKGSRFESFAVSPDLGPNPDYTLSKGFGVIGKVMRFEDYWYIMSFIRLFLGSFSSKGIVDGVMMLFLQAQAFSHVMYSSHCKNIWNAFGKPWPLAVVIIPLMVFSIGNICGHMNAMIFLWDEVSVGTVPGSMALYGMCFYSILYYNCKYIITFIKRLCSRKKKQVDEDFDDLNNISIASPISENVLDTSIFDLDTSFGTVEVIPQKQDSLNDSFNLKELTRKVRRVRRLACFFVNRKILLQTLFIIQMLYWLILPLVIPIGTIYAVWGGFISGIIMSMIIIQITAMVSPILNFGKISFFSFLKHNVISSVAILFPLLTITVWQTILLIIFLSRTDPQATYTPSFNRYLGITLNQWKVILEGSI